MVARALTKAVRDHDALCLVPPHLDATLDSQRSFPVMDVVRRHRNSLFSKFSDEFVELERELRLEFARRERSSTLIRSVP